MPGLSFIADFRGHSTARGPHILSALTTLLESQQWQAKTFIESAHYFLGLNSYADYPIASYETADYRIFIEGKIYSHSPQRVSKELFELAESLFASEPTIQDRCGQWILNTDGDYLIFIIHRSSNKAWILNDMLGRLPVYYRYRNQSIVISRELRFITSLQSIIEFDRLGIAQYLIFGYPLGTRTLIDGVCRLRPGSVVSITPASKDIAFKVLYEFNFDNRPNASHTIENNTASLISLFTESCKARTNLNGLDGNNILGLSGGLDSRSIAACLAANNIPFTALTRLDSAKTSVADARVAKILAKALDIEWSLIKVGVPSGTDLLALLRLKTGLNPLGMVSRVSFLDKIRTTQGSGITFFTGDGGDKIFHDLGPARKLKTLDDLVHYTISTNKIFELESVASMTGISAADITDDLRNHFSSYVELNLAEKYVHFLIFERAFKWLFEGEDRNRCYFWSVAPFYSIPLFKYAMECPDAQKTYYRLYRSFLMKLSPLAASIDNATWDIPISSNRSILYLFCKTAARRIMPRVVREMRTVHQTAIPSLYMECLTRQLRDCPAIKEYLPSLTVQDIREATSQSRLSILLSLTSTIEDLQYGRSSLSCYRASILE